MLQAFLRDEFSEENAVFWQKCEEYRKSTNAAYRKQLARLIYADHVAELSADQVNIDANVRHSVERRLSMAPANLFDAAQRQVYLLMKYDPYPRFLRSRLYCDIVDEERLGKRLETSAAGIHDRRQIGGGLLSRLRLRWKRMKESKSTTKDDSGQGSSLSSSGSDGNEYSGKGEETPSAMTPARLLNHLLRRRSTTKSTQRDSVESSTAATPSSSPTARRSLFFNRWRRSTDVDDDDDARSVSTVTSTKTTTADFPHRRRPRRHPSTHSHLSVAPSHVIRCDAEERRRFAAVMARVAAAGGEGRTPAPPVLSDSDVQRCQQLDAGGRQRSTVTNEVYRRRYRHRRRATQLSDSAVEYTIYYV